MRVSAGRDGELLLDRGLGASAPVVASKARPGVRAALTELDILKIARDRIATPDTWIQGPAAYRDDGAWTNGYDPRAIRYGLTGALQVGGDRDIPARVRARKRVENCMTWDRCGFRSTLDEFNDYWTTEHQDVLDLLDKAIEQCEAEAVS